jgi:hypothetical protein
VHNAMPRLRVTHQPHEAIDTLASTELASDITSDVTPAAFGILNRQEIGNAQTIASHARG